MGLSPEEVDVCWGSSGILIPLDPFLIQDIHSSPRLKIMGFSG